MSGPEWAVDAACKICHGEHTHMNAANYMEELASERDSEFTIKAIDDTAAIIAAHAPKVDVDWNRVEFEAYCWEGPDYIVSIDYKTFNTIIIFDGPGRTLNKSEAELIAQALNANKGRLQEITAHLGGAAEPKVDVEKLTKAVMVSLPQRKVGKDVPVLMTTITAESAMIRIRRAITDHLEGGAR